MSADDDLLARVMREIAASERRNEDLIRIEITIRREMGGERWYLQKPTTVAHRLQKSGHFGLTTVKKR